MRVARTLGFLCLPLSAIDSPAQDFSTLTLPANAIRFSTSTGMLYATVPSSAGLPYGNCLVEISPIDATVTRGVWVGSEPNALAISPDAPVAYVGLSGAAAVRKVDLEQFVAGLQFSLGQNYPFDGPYFPDELAVMPGHPETVAVSRRNLYSSPWFEGVVVYDDGVARPTTVPGGALVAANSIAFGSDPSVLYGFDHQDSNEYLTRMSIDASGVTVTETATAYFSAVKITADGSTVFGDYGDVADGQTLQTIGHFDASGPEIVVAPTHSVVFANGIEIEVFNRFSYSAGPVISLFWEFGRATSATACGLDCLAVAYESNIIVINGYNGVVFANNFD